MADDVNDSCKRIQQVISNALGSDQGVVDAVVAGGAVAGRASTDVGSVGRGYCCSFFPPLLLSALPLPAAQTRLENHSSAFAIIGDDSMAL